MTHVSGVEPSHARLRDDLRRRSTTTVAATSSRTCSSSNDFGKTFRSIASNLPTDRPGSVYVIREDPVNPNLLYVGTETGVFASLEQGAELVPARRAICRRFRSTI